MDRSKYYFDIKTDKNLGSERFVRELLTKWSSGLSPSLRPEFFDLGEPIRRSLVDEGVEAAVHTWLDNGMALMLRRKSKPGFVVDIDWWRRQNSLDPRPFPWSCRVWLNRNAGDELALEFFRFLLTFFEPAFGRLTTESDDREKHFISLEDRKEVVETYEGTDVGDTLPGVYWVTYFGPWAVEKIGEERFANLKAEKVESIDGGYMVQAYSLASEAGSSLAQEAETRIMNRLGKLHFFSKASVDMEALRTSPEEAELVEEKIKELKAKKRQAK